MIDGDLRDQIAGIEADIEQLAKTLDGCRKAMLFFQGGYSRRRDLDIGISPRGDQFDPAAMIGAIAATIGGVVIFGSNSSTSKHTTVAIKAAEICRAELIDMIDLRTVSATGS